MAKWEGKIINLVYNPISSHYYTNERIDNRFQPGDKEFENIDYFIDYFLNGRRKGLRRRLLTIKAINVSKENLEKLKKEILSEYKRTTIEAIISN